MKKVMLTLFSIILSISAITHAGKKRMNDRRSPNSPKYQQKPINFGVLNSRKGRAFKKRTRAKKRGKEKNILQEKRKYKQRQQKRKKIIFIENNDQKYRNIYRRT